MIICGVIPIRLDSSRFPGKGLAKLAGKEVVLHVYDRAREYRRFDRLIVATDDTTIKKLIEDRGGEVFFSQTRFRNGSERVAAAIADVNCDVCVNIQGDEVFITPEAIDQAVLLLERHREIEVATVVFPPGNGIELRDRNLVKAKFNEDEISVIFSREPFEDTDGEVNFGHVGVYAYRKSFLMRYPELEPTADEIEHSLEQLRILGHGYRIGAAVVERPLPAINTPSDLATAEQILSSEGG